MTNPARDTSLTEPSAQVLDIQALSTFKFERVLSESSLTGSIFLLGQLQGVPAILHVQRTAIAVDQAVGMVMTGIRELDVFLENRPYFSSHASLLPSPTPDLLLKVIWPATETHIKKYTAQDRVMITETAEMFESIVVPFIESFPASRLDWVYAILGGRKEAERVLFRDEDPEEGFLILPDLKWDQTTMTALYLSVIVQTRSIRCLRDLTPTHLPMLRRIKQQVYRTVQEKFGVEGNRLRLFVHYHPSYYHFHIHVVHIQHEALAGMVADQAHLLDDLITLLELSPAPPQPSILARMNLTYALGVEHDLYKLLNKQPGEVVPVPTITRIDLTKRRSGVKFALDHSQW